MSWGTETKTERQERLYEVWRRAREKAERTMAKEDAFAAGRAWSDFQASFVEGST